MSSSSSERSALVLGLILVLGAALAACSPVAAGDPGTAQPPASTVPDEQGDADDPDRPVTGGPGEPAEPPQDGDGALHVEPQAGIVDATPHAWDRITVGSDGRTITVYYWGGVQDCYGLAGVTAERDDEGVLHVTVFEGQRGNLGQDVACIEIALLKSVVVTLDDPLVAPAD
ncbi:MAG: hypothetical protein M3253_06705 [Chloroflexota bacterium]|nr:hypothetical protein [Chloroflexota bacterium]